MTRRIGTLLRERDGHAHARVGFVELFFDLVFVFAVTQLSHSLLDHLTPLGALQTGMMLLAVWWAWIYTAWCTNWLDPDRMPVRLMLFALMAAGLVMASAIPQAFDGRGVVFAWAYAAIQVGHTAFLLWAVRRDEVLRRNFVRVIAWLVAGAVFWLLGGYAEGERRLLFWGLALAIEYVSPAVSFWLPGLGRSSTTDWNVEGHHMAERSGLFMIIALGESVLVMGATFAGLQWTPEAVAAFAAAFVGALAMWWIYFAGASDAASEVIAASDDPGRIARRAYTYCPIVLVAGVIVTAVGDEIALKHPGGHTELAAALVLLGGPALFLLGSLLFKLAVFGTWSPSRLTGLALLAALAPFALQFTPLGLSLAATGVLLVVSAWETVHIARLHAAKAAA